MPTNRPPVRTNLQHRERPSDRAGTGKIAVFPRPSRVPPPTAKRMLVVSSHFPPERAAGVHRILRTIKQLRASAWPVAVLTVDPRYYRAGAPVDAALLDRLPEGVEVHRTKVLRGLTIAARWRRQFLQGIRRIVSRVLTRGGRRVSEWNLSPRGAPEGGVGQTPVYRYGDRLVPAGDP